MNLLWQILIGGIALALAIYRLSFDRRIDINTSGIVLITGASTGIGRHAAEYLAEKQKNLLVLAAVRKEADFQGIADMNIANLQPITLDVANHESCIEAVESIKLMMQETGLPFVGLVNNAGIAGRAPLEVYPMAYARQIFDVNFFGVIDITQLLLPFLRASHGRIVMVSSVAGFLSTATGGVYASSKFALEKLSDTLRREVKSLNVSVSIVEPGYVKSAIFDSSKESMKLNFAGKEDSLLATWKSVYPQYWDKSETEEVNKAPGPIVTSEAIYDALLSASPKIRYPVAGALGLSAGTLSNIFWALSDRIDDYLFAHAPAVGKIVKSIFK